MQPNFLYKPLREISYTPEDLGLKFEDVYFHTVDDLMLNGWHLVVDKDAPTILFCHGNGGNMTHRLDTVNFFYEMKINCFIFDYRGYGKSEGKPTEEGTYMDVSAAYKWLTRTRKIHARDVIIFGRSLGGSIAALTKPGLTPFAPGHTWSCP